MMNQLFPINTIEPDTKLKPEQQEKIDFALSIDFNPLLYCIIEQMGVHLDMTSVELKMIRGDILVVFETSSVLSGAGFFRNLLKSCNVVSFSNGIKKDTLDDFVTEELRYWVSISVQYKHANGGENGMDIASANYTETKGWVYSPIRKVSEE